MRPRKYVFEVAVDAQGNREPDWAPLELFSDIAGTFDKPALVVPCHFMHMGEEVHRSGQRLQLYKHRYSRRYVVIDEFGYPHRFVRGEEAANPGAWVSWYAPMKTPTVAVDRLDLGITPPARLAVGCIDCLRRIAAFPSLDPFRYLPEAA